MEEIRVLLIEDNVGDARLVQEILSGIEGQAYALSWAKNLADGIQRLREDRFHVVLLDLSLPDSKGITTIQKIHEAASQLPLIVLTGLDDEQVGLQAVQEGAQDYVVKSQLGTAYLSRIIRYAIERTDTIEALKNSQQTLLATKAELEQAFIRLKDELETARLVQKSLLPQDLKNIAGVELAGAYQPSEVLGGDLYDVIELDDGKLALLVLDVAGHGVSSALVAAMAVVSFRRHIPYSRNPESVFSEVNKELISFFPDNIYLTAFLGILDRNTRVFHYSCAGHPPAMLVHCFDGTVDMLKTKGPFIGLLDNSTYRSETVPVSGDDKIVLYTDGLIESLRADNQMYGKDRLANILTQTRNLSSRQTVEEILSHHKQFIAGGNQMDDITLLVAKIS